MKTASKPPQQIGYPVLVRPSLCAGRPGHADRAMTTETLRHYLAKRRGDRRRAIRCWWTSTSAGKEVEVDAICDGKDVFVPGIMELVERTGIHSGDSISVYPTFSH